MATIQGGTRLTQYEDLDLPGEMVDMTPADLAAWVAWNEELDREWEMRRDGEDGGEQGGR